MEGLKDGLDSYKDINEGDNYHVHNAVDSYESVLEHIYFSFYIENISRACSHQLVRHRIASYTQRSQRHRGDVNFYYVVPESIRTNEDAMDIYFELMNEINDKYQYLMDIGVPREDARYVLPNSATTDIMVTMNVRALRNFFKARCCKLAQWEIREVANRMLDICQSIYPELFVNCRGYCEGHECPYNHRCEE
jgi:thymidylate synthase (FAD)